MRKGNKMVFLQASDGAQCDPALSNFQGWLGKVNFACPFPPWVESLVFVSVLMLNSPLPPDGISNSYGAKNLCGDGGAGDPGADQLRPRWQRDAADGLADRCKERLQVE